MIFTRQDVNIAVLGLVFWSLRLLDGVIVENSGNALRRKHAFLISLKLTFLMKRKIIINMNK